MTDFITAICVFIGVSTWILALRTEDPIGLTVHSVLSSSSFAVATYLVLSTR